MENNPKTQEKQKENELWVQEETSRNHGNLVKSNILNLFSWSCVAI